MCTLARRCTEYLRRATRGTGRGTGWPGTGRREIFSVYPPVLLEFEPSDETNSKR